MTFRRFSVAGLCAVALAAVVTLGGCGGSKSTVTPGTDHRAGVLEWPAAPASFAPYRAVPLIGQDAPAYGGAATPTSLAKVEVAKSLQPILKQVPALAALLEKQGFAVVPSGSSLFQTEYEGSVYGGFPVYVTTDAAYNAWHLAFDKILRDLEQSVLLPKLDQLVTGLRAAAHAQTISLKGTKLEADASRAEQIFQVAAAELGIPGALGPLAQQEKALIDAHDQSNATSPILGQALDYSLFTPRGHYNLTPKLRRFFLGMSVLGQLSFCLPGTAGCPGVGPLRVAFLALRPFDPDSGDRRLQGLWHDIYDPTSFLVGLSDDYTPSELFKALPRAVPGLDGIVAAFGDDATVTKVAKALVSLRPVKIDPQRAALRIMGTRFTADEFLLDQLVYPHVGTATKKRQVPSGLDLAAAFGSSAARSALASSGASAYAHYDDQLAAVTAAVTARPAAEWGGTVYDAWLSALQPVFVAHGPAFPDYMRSEAWSAKDLQSGLGSYAELKHDTILFAKQLVAEAGGDFYPGKPRHWVEPDPVAFERLAAATDLLSAGLAKRHELTTEAAGLLRTESDLFTFLGRIGRDELAGRPISAKDNKRLRTIGDVLASIWWRSSERSNPNPSIPSQSAIVADIASGPKGALEIATGDIQTLFVIVPTDHGTFELARGGVYTYYEFLSPPGERLTDEAWRARLQKRPAPASPDWQSVFRVACPKGSVVCSPSFIPG